MNYIDIAMGDDNVSKDWNHLKSDIGVWHGALWIKVFEEKFDVGAALPPVPSSSTWLVTPSLQWNIFIPTTSIG